MEQILVTGALGQIGSDLVDALRQKYGTANVLSTDIRNNLDDPNYAMLDILNKQRFREVMGDHKITQVYHLAAILSANGEWNPAKTWNVNFNAFLSLLELSNEMSIDKVFFPATIAVHGPTTPKTNTPQYTDLSPETVYGISKVSCELWANYYHKRYGLDVRSLRYPGVIGWKALPHGGTTDYAVEIFHAALKGEHYTCFLDADTRLPMMYIDDAIRATIELMDAPADQLTVRTSYNLAAMSFTPAEIAAKIQERLPNFTIDYQADFRQAIAATWSESIDDSLARKDWNWAHQYNLDNLVDEMLHQLVTNKIVTHV
ncbi:MAG: NAD-dependent epimerase/dehydratase family protein [Saprospiraceae bacterium]|nr:NAD-dependent epimerase/dehydratase family protein [Saprospiraceae bacterium]